MKSGLGYVSATSSRTDKNQGRCQLCKRGGRGAFSGFFWGRAVLRWWTAPPGGTGVDMFAIPFRREQTCSGENPSVSGVERDPSGKKLSEHQNQIAGWARPRARLWARSSRKVQRVCPPTLLALSHVCFLLQLLWNCDSLLFWEMWTTPVLYFLVFSLRNNSGHLHREDAPRSGEYLVVKSSVSLTSCLLTSCQWGVPGDCGSFMPRSLFSIPALNVTVSLMILLRIMFLPILHISGAREREFMLFFWRLAVCPGVHGQEILQVRQKWESMATLSLFRTFCNESHSSLSPNSL